jgi:hypothetical protein
MVRKQTKRRKKAVKTKAAKRKKTTRRQRPARRRGRGAGSRAQIHQGVALEQAGQSGDLQGLSSTEDVDSESVAELVEEGQAFEAGIVDGVENAPDADEGGVRTHEIPEDDVRPEYRGYREGED